MERYCSERILRYSLLVVFINLLIQIAVCGGETSDSESEELRPHAFGLTSAQLSQNGSSVINSLQLKRTTINNFTPSSVETVNEQSSSNSVTKLADITSISSDLSGLKVASLTSNSKTTSLSDDGGSTVLMESPTVLFQKSTTVYQTTLPMKSITSALTTSQNSQSMSENQTASTQTVESTLHTTMQSQNASTNSATSASSIISSSSSSIISPSSRSSAPVSSSFYSNSSHSSTEAISASSMSSQSHIVTPSTSTIHTTTVTFCPWDKLITAGIIMPSSSIPHVLSTSIQIQNASDIVPAKRECDFVLQELSNAVSNLSYCMLKFSHPMEVCRKCTSPLTNMEVHHRSVFKKCENALISNYFESYQIIPKVYGFQRSMWYHLQCDKCYESRDQNDPTAAWKPTSEFTTFENSLMNTMKCFANYSRIALPYPVKLNDTHRRNSSQNEICTDCNHVYSEFRKLIKSENDDENPEKKWCADMVYGVSNRRR
eukprot:gene239-856_t